MSHAEEHHKCEHQHHQEFLGFAADRCALEQSRIADVLDKLDNKVATLTTKQTHYQSLKRGLMQKLLTGEWRVRVPASGYNS
ncbi:MAG: hypothetical protein IPH37_13175 [Burkholderiales bacterium]|nr:hypothetical protein [Burkholderiales bacterium]